MQILLLVLRLSDVGTDLLITLNIPYAQQDPNGPNKESNNGFSSSTGAALLHKVSKSTDICAPLYIITIVTYCFACCYSPL